MNKIAVSLVAITLTLLSIPVSAQDTLSDIEGHKNQEAIEYLIEDGVIQGYPDGTYKPNASSNRAEFTKIIVEATFNQDSINGCLEKEMQPGWTYTFFPDVDRNAWYAKYICVAKVSGMISGYPDGNFRPDQGINKAEAIKIVTTAKNYLIPEEVEGQLYSDVKSGDWYAPYVRVAMNYNLLEETGTAALGADLAISRAEMSEMAYRILVSGAQAYKPGLRLYGKEKKSIEEYLADKEMTEFIAKMNEKANISKVSITDESALEEELKNLTLSLIYAEVNEENGNKLLELIDEPDLNYIDYKNKANNQKQISIQEELIADGFPTSIEDARLEKLYQTAYQDIGLPSGRSQIISETDLDFYYDDDVALIGIARMPNPEYGTTQYGLSCIPFIYDGHWKLKLSNLHLSENPIDFANQNFVEACKSSLLTDNPKIESEDLVGAGFSYKYGLPVNIFLNDHLIEHLLSAGGGVSNSHYLPLKEGENTIEIVNINPYTDMLKIEGTFGDTFTPNVELSIGSLVEIEFSKEDDQKTYTFDYNATDQE